jgi:hypothetical protein
MLLLCVAILAILASVASVPMVQAVGAPQANVTFYSGPVGVIKDDVLRVNVTNLNATTQQAQVSVIDEKGLTKGKTTLTLAPAQTGFFDLTLSGLVGRLMVRTQAKCANNLFLVSTEIYDASTQQTNVTLSEGGLIVGSLTAMSPAIGITDQETARLAVANLGATTAQITLDFLEQDGKVIQSATLSIAPKQIGFFDYDGIGLVGRRVVRGATSGAGAGKLRMTLEVFNTLTSRTGFLEQDFIWFPS